MPYTLNKLKQSEVDHGYHEFIVENNRKPTYGIFVVGFVVFLIVSLVLLKETQDLLDEPAVLSVKHGVVEQKRVSDRNNANKVADKKLLNDNSETKQLSAEKKINKLTMADKIQLRAPPANIDTFIAGSGVNNQNDMDVPVEISTNARSPKNSQIKKIEEDSINVDEDVSFFSQEMDVALNEELDLEDDSLEHDLEENAPKAFPKIKLNGVIFLDDEKDRYVLINMEKFYVDDKVNVDLTVEDIKQDSVVMRYGSRQFSVYMNE